MALLNCPDCGKRMSTLETSCPQCGRRPDGTSTRVSFASPGSELDDWLRLRAKISGALLIGGFLLPVLLSGFGGTRLLWAWDLMSSMKPHQVLGTLVSPLLGAGVLAAARLLSGARLAALLAGLAGVAWILSSILTPGTEGTLFSKNSVGSVSVFTLLPLCAGAVAIGNHLRKGRPDASPPRALAGAGGIVLVLCFLLPVDGGSPIIGAFFQSLAWRFAGPVMVVFLGLLGYGVLGILSWKRVSDEASYTRLVSILGRTLLWGAPITILVNFGFMTGGWGLGMAFTLTAKMFAVWYGHLILLAASVAALLESRLARRSSTASPGTRARPTSRPTGRATT